ncbi:hypothetical protein EUGRSUZ_D00773 [Eucalyptus grandis]|uniref:Uncharacterized protein n=3 Tax=Eucalyptus TaxID=3932 RepID=A0ACC3L4C2_EUCGR|nr:hypothetical protein EUGRSUZ_D00773 [Eucalyptus grandis]
MATRGGAVVAFEDFFPVMVERLGARGFMEELSKGFRLLMDKEKGVITLDSLRRNAALMGLSGMSDDDVRSMLQEGDLDGDGTLDEKEFCVLMFRLSPGLMKGSKEMLEEAIDS